MELGLHLWGRKFWLCCVLVHVVGATSELAHAHSTISVSTPHLFYNCPEGATVKLPCSQKGAPLHPTDALKHAWLFTPHSDQHCTAPVGQPNIGKNHGAHSHGNHTLKPGVQYGSEGQTFWLSLQNVTHAAQGRYCCVVLDFVKDHMHKAAQRAHNHIILHVTPRTNGSQACTFYDLTPPGGSVPVALAIAACILALLSLPLILLLVYKQRHTAQSSRRAQELVRMDSEAQGHENPVFLGGSPQVKTRTVSQIMTRQPSETGRHLLSDPGTPFSPPAHGDVFFPIEDTIPESPDFL